MMKRIGWLLVPLLWLLAACGAGTTQLGNPTAVAGPGDDTPPTAAATVAAGDSDAATDVAPPAAEAGDPTQARDRDWKLGDLEDPAVTIIEYGDFQ